MPQHAKGAFPEAPHPRLAHVIAQVERVVIGKRAAVETVLVAVLGGGHVLVEDVPGVGKTVLVRALAKALGCSFARIQFTPDLLPSDVTGVSVYDPREGRFSFRPGPVMANIVLADEINRTSPRTQAALLEAMEEGSVTVDGVTHDLPRPFVVLATQNPVEFEGTYPLPEAQRDRFLLTLRLGYPTPDEEVAMLTRLQLAHPVADVEPVLDPDGVRALQDEVRHVRVDEAVKAYIVALVHETR
ncbi:AAA family ATPase, partial [Calditerricola satsumensis]|uniref:AAA family ATPase n=1 Tax=Calditerricola satsumensis TaxID=373054 RepID=UPI0006CF4BE6